MVERIVYKVHGWLPTTEDKEGVSGSLATGQKGEHIDCDILLKLYLCDKLFLWHATKAKKMPCRRRKCDLCLWCDCVWACLKGKMKMNVMRCATLEQLIPRPTFNVLIFTFSYSDFYCITFSPQKWRFQEDTKQGRVWLKLTVIDNRYCWKSF